MAVRRRRRQDRAFDQHPGRKDGRAAGGSGSALPGPEAAYGSIVRPGAGGPHWHQRSSIGAGSQECSADPAVALRSDRCSPDNKAAGIKAIEAHDLEPSVQALKKERAGQFTGYLVHRPARASSTVGAEGDPPPPGFRRLHVSHAQQVSDAGAKRMNLPAVNLCIVQPAGYVYSLLFLDPARYLRYHLRRLGVDCTLTRNRLARDRVNIVFGAHVGFDRALAHRFCCVIFNTEQIGAGGAHLPEAYLDLLHTLPSLDSDPSNRDSYASPLAGPVIPIMDAPFLRSGPPALPLAERPFDLLFFGVVNDRRANLLAAIESAGCQVTLFDKPLFGPERDQFIRQSKAVLNLHHYELARFEQIRVAHCLSLGTPVISERTPATSPAAHFENAVFFLPTDELPRFVGQTFRSPGFYSDAKRMLRGFQSRDPLAQFGELVAYLQSVQHAWCAAPTTETTLRMCRVSLGSG